MKVLFILNPTAGNGRAGKEWPLVEEIIKDEFPGYKVERTEYPGHATEIAGRAIGERYDTIVSCGGDGTLNEVLNGVVGSDVKIGLIPLGTGSDFGKTIGVRDIRRAIEVLKGEKVKKADVAMATFNEEGKRRYFINSLEIGFGAEVMRYVNSHPRYGRLSFIIGILSVLRKLRKFRIANGSNNPEMETIEVIVANGKYFGGGMLASPSSSISDGILDIHILRPVSRLTTIMRLRNLMDGSYIEKGFSHESKAKEIHFSNEGNLVEMDGEVVGKTPVTVSIRENEINLIVP